MLVCGGGPIIAGACDEVQRLAELLAAPVATRLYLPQAWAEDAERRTQAHVPEAVGFQTKAEIALALLDEANACGVQHACVTCDADYGDNPKFLNGLDNLGADMTIYDPGALAAQGTVELPNRAELMDGLIAFNNVAELFNAVQALGFWWTCSGERSRPPLRGAESSPGVDVMIPVYDEPVPIVEPTVAAAVAMTGARHTVHLLDDGDNPEMERRCQEVIDRCWALGAENPISFIHDVGAGGLSNALPELVNDGGRGGRFDCLDTGRPAFASRSKGGCAHGNDHLHACRGLDDLNCVAGIDWPGEAVRRVHRATAARRRRSPPP